MAEHTLSCVSNVRGYEDQCTCGQHRRGVSRFGRFGNWNDRRHAGDNPTERGLTWRVLDHIASWGYRRGW